MPDIAMTLDEDDWVRIVVALDLTAVRGAAREYKLLADRIERKLTEGEVGGAS